MDDRVKLIGDLESSKLFIEQSMALGEKIQDQKQKMEEYENSYYYASSAGVSIIAALILAFKIFIGVAVSVGIIEVLIEFFSSHAPFDFLFTKGGLIVLAVLSTVGAFIYDKITADGVRSLADSYKEKEEEATLEYRRAIAELKLHMESDEAKLTRALVPPDYYYPAAVDKFIYYLRNGHADNMKEAVRMYDEFLHRQVMEEEARKVTANTEAAAEAATISAQKSIELVQKQESVEFWTLYNACQLENINNKLR